MSDCLWLFLHLSQQSSANYNDQFFFVVMDSFGLLSYRLSGEAWLLLQIGLGGYVVGRSGEKIVKKFKG
jgi:hypothetical protein